MAEPQALLPADVPANTAEYTRESPGFSLHGDNALFFSGKGRMGTLCCQRRW